MFFAVFIAIKTIKRTSVLAAQIGSILCSLRRDTHTHTPTQTGKRRHLPLCVPRYVLLSLYARFLCGQASISPYSHLPFNTTFSSIPPSQESHLYMHSSLIIINICKQCFPPTHRQRPASGRRMSRIITLPCSLQRSVPR